MLNRKRHYIWLWILTILIGSVPFGGSSDTLAQGVERPFELLVIGDSLIWGQGLKEEDKFYSHTADWLRREVFGPDRKVNLKVKAHSGATIKFDSDEAEKYRRIGRDEGYFYPGEVNIGFPSMWHQVTAAQIEYREQGHIDGADLIMITACITDIAVEGVLDPFNDKEKLKPQIQQNCRDLVLELMEHAALSHPNAKIALVGYYPILSPRSPTSTVMRGWFEILNLPRMLQFIANNKFTRVVYLNRLKKKGLERSRIWIDDSNRYLQEAVDNFNSKFPSPRAIFVEAPLTEDDAVETPVTLLFRIKKDGTTDDPLYPERAADCRRELSELRRNTGIEYSITRCERAAVGHPNIAGSKAYADAINKALLTFLR